MTKHSFELDGAPHWEVETILNHEHRLVGNRIKTFYLVRWSGFSSEHDTLEPEANLRNCTGPLAVYSDAVRLAGGTLDPPEALRNKLQRRRKVDTTSSPPPATRTTRSGRQLSRPAAFEGYAT